MKGQVEIVAILGVIVVIAVVAYFALSGVGPAPEAPTGVQQEQLQVKNSIENMIRSGAQETMRTLSLYGGYSSPDQFPMGSVLLNGEEAPYWFYQGNSQVPNLETSLTQGIGDYIRENKAALQASLSGQEVVIGDPSVSSRLLANQLIVDVTMQVSVRGYPITGPYSVTVPTSLGEVREFSQALVNFISSDRFFEDVTFYQILGSRMDNGVQVLPIFVSPVKCGQSIYLDRYMLKPEMEEAVRSGLAHTYLPGQYPTNVMQSTSFMKFSLPELDGKSYEGLKVTFHTADDFELDEDTFQVSPNPITTVAKPVPLTGACAAEPVYVNYYVLYPAIAQVRDPLTGNLFRFAFQVFLKDNQPGSWGDAGYTTSAQALICQDTACTARVAVRNSAGDSLPGTRIRFMGCGYTAGADGVFEGNIPCGVGALTAYYEGYGLHEASVSSDELAILDLTLYKQPLVTLYFHEASVQNDSLGSYYIIDPDGIRWIRNEIRPEESVTLSMTSKETGEIYNRFYDTSSAGIQLPVGDYYMSAMLNSPDLLTSYGAFEQDITLSEETKSLHLYIPYMEGFSQLQDNTTIMYASTLLTKVLQNCSVGPVSGAPVSLAQSCYIAYGDL